MNLGSIITKFDMFLVILFEPCLNRPKTARPQPKASAAVRLQAFLWALRSSCAWLTPIKKALRNRKDFCWSGWRDSNSRPLAPQASALPGCATSRFGCLIWPKPNLPVVKHMGTGHPKWECKDTEIINLPQTLVSRKCHSNDL